jgi:hypothetical protein
LGSSRPRRGRREGNRETAGVRGRASDAEQSHFDLRELADEKPRQVVSSAEVGGNWADDSPAGNGMSMAEMAD